jgi:hypothetical protein
VVHSTSMISASAALRHLFEPRVRVGSEAADHRHRIAARIMRRGERHNRYFTPMPCSRRRPRALLAPALRGCTHPRAMLQTPLGSTHGRADDCANPLVSLPQGQLQRPRARPRGRRHGRRGGDFSTVGSRIGRASFGTTRLITGTSRCRRQTRNTMAADSHCAAMRRSRRPNRMPGGGHRESKVGRYCNRRSCSHGK